MREVVQLPDGRLLGVGEGGPGYYKPGQGPGFLWTQADGSSWKRLKAPNAQSIWTAAAVGNTVVIAGLDGRARPRVWSSEAAQTWSRPVSVDGAVGSLTGGLSGFLGAGGTTMTSDDVIPAALAFHSSDGSEWTTTTLAQAGEATVAIEGPDGRMVVAGAIGDTRNNVGAPGTRAAIWTSADGTAWAQTTFGDGLASGWWAPAGTWTPVGYVVLLFELPRAGGDWIRHVVWSPDGIGWTDTVPAGFVGTDVSALGQGILAIGSDSDAISLDGRTWSNSPEAFGIWTGRHVGPLSDGRVIAWTYRFTDDGDPESAIWIGTAKPDVQSSSPVPGSSGAP